MISYEAYKILHLFTLLTVVSAIGAIIAEGKWISNKSFKVIIGLFSFFIFVGGMGLIARLGFKHGEPFPAWILIKIACWIMLNISLVMLFRRKDVMFKKIFGVLGALSVLVAVYAAVTKFLV